MQTDEKFHELSVRIGRRSDGSAAATLWVRLRQGGMFPAVQLEWSAGAPTPQQLEMLEAAVLEEVQRLVLTTVGVQGALFPTGGEPPQ